MRQLYTIVIAFVFGFGGICVGESAGYNRGLSEGVAISKGDRWDCAYSYVTGFLMCDRTPKYK